MMRNTKETNKGISRDLLIRLENAADQTEIDRICWAYIDSSATTRGSSLRVGRLWDSGYILKGLTFETPDQRS